MRAWGGDKGRGEGGGLGRLRGGGGAVRVRRARSPHGRLCRGPLQTRWLADEGEAAAGGAAEPGAAPAARAGPGAAEGGGGGVGVPAGRQRCSNMRLRLQQRSRVLVGTSTIPSEGRAGRRRWQVAVRVRVVGRQPQQRGGRPAHTPTAGRTAPLPVALRHACPPHPLQTRAGASIRRSGWPKTSEAGGGERGVVGSPAGPTTSRLAGPRPHPTRPPPPYPSHPATASSMNTISMWIDVNVV